MNNKYERRGHYKIKYINESSHSFERLSYIKLSI